MLPYQFCYSHTECFISETELIQRTKTDVHFIPQNDVRSHKFNILKRNPQKR